MFKCSAKPVNLRMTMAADRDSRCGVITHEDAESCMAGSCPRACPLPGTAVPLARTLGMNSHKHMAEAVTKATAIRAHVHVQGRALDYDRVHGRDQHID